MKISDLPQFFERLIDNSVDSIKEQFGETAKAIQEDMREEGKPSTSPVQWDSEKQRKAYFASDGFGAGIPYVRKGNYVNGWQTKELPNGWQISNKHPAGAVGGTLEANASLVGQGGVSTSSWQSKIHRGRWKSFMVTAQQRVSEMQKKIIERLRIKVKENE